jgi:hypothetical protein
MKRSIEDSPNPDLANLPQAMRDAARLAREEAANHGEPIVVMRKGRIVKLKPPVNRKPAA